MGEPGASPRGASPRGGIAPGGHRPGGASPRGGIAPGGHRPGGTSPRGDIAPGGHRPGGTSPRADIAPGGHRPGRTSPRGDIAPGGHRPGGTSPRGDIAPGGHRPGGTPRKSRTISDEPGSPLISPPRAIRRRSPCRCGQTPFCPRRRDATRRPCVPRPGARGGQDVRPVDLLITLRRQPGDEQVALLIEQKEAVALRRQEGVGPAHGFLPRPGGREVRPHALAVLHVQATQFAVAVHAIDAVALDERGGHDGVQFVRLVGLFSSPFAAPQFLRQQLVAVGADVRATGSRCRRTSERACCRSGAAWGW